MTMQELFEHLQEYKQIKQNQAATDIQIAMTNVKLKYANLPLLPEDFSNILSISNGMSGNGATIFGIVSKNDLLQYNLSLPKSENTLLLILGYDKSSYLTYNPENKAYNIVDKQNTDNALYQDTLVNLISYMMKI